MHIFQDLPRYLILISFHYFSLFQIILEKKTERKEWCATDKTCSNAATKARARTLHFLSIKTCLVVTQNVLLYSHKLLGLYSTLKKELVQQQHHQLN